MQQKPKDNTNNPLNDKQTELTDLNRTENTATKGDCDVRIETQKDNSVVVTMVLKATAAAALSKVGGLLQTAKPKVPSTAGILTESEAKEISMRSIRDVTNCLNETLKSKDLIKQNIALHDFHPAFSTIRH